MKYMKYAILIAFSMGVGCWGVKGITESFTSTMSYMRADGLLVEPYFFLLPLGALFIAVGILLTIIRIVVPLVRQR